MIITIINFSIFFHHLVRHKRQIAFLNSEKRDTLHVAKFCKHWKSMMLQFAGATKELGAHFPSKKKHIRKHILQFCNFDTLAKGTRSINKLCNFSHKYYLGINTVFHLTFSPRLFPPPSFLFNFISVHFITRCQVLTSHVFSPR